MECNAPKPERTLPQRADQTEAAEITAFIAELGIAPVPDSELAALITQRLALRAHTTQIRQHLAELGLTLPTAGTSD